MQKWEYACATIKGISGLGEVIFYLGNGDQKEDWGSEAIRRLTNEGWEMTAALAMAVPPAHISDLAEPTLEPYQILWFKRPKSGGA